MASTPPPETLSAPVDAPDGAEPERSGIGVVVGIDGSDCSAHALRWALQRADEFGPVRPVLTWQYPVWAMSDPIPSGASLATFEDFEAGANREALNSVAAVDVDGVCEPVVVVHGPAGSTLLEHLDRAGLLVVGTRGRGLIADGVLGSVSGHVVRHATRPVVVVPETAPLTAVNHRVVVGVDGSPNSVEALAWALSHSPAETTIEAVYIWSHLVRRVPEPYVIPTEASEAVAKDTLDEAVAAAMQLAGTDRPVVAILDYGDDPRNVLVDRASGADQLILGARGRGGLAHLFLGSVVTSLIHQPTVTTVVVPAGRR